MNQKSISPKIVTISWCTDVAKNEALTQLFVMNARTEYISHSELQGPRAETTTRWRSDLAATLREEFQTTLSQDPSSADSLIAVADIDGVIAGMALVSIGNQDAAIPYASLDDVIVHPDYRGAGLGHQLIEWVEQQMLARGIKRLFLESGEANHDAHRFFKAHSFQTVSVVMMKELGNE
ncbi:GNAT family N-acetyltransferase [Herminiimonas sp. NPDC097707]|uniref:GNAT family N-acetyltransferase n=1 Tax=Herminiimonas sp. NPDC097707 TaxID=3364007 RepID=UPI00383A11D2